MPPLHLLLRLSKTPPPSYCMRQHYSPQSVIYDWRRKIGEWLIFSKRLQTNRHRTSNQRYVHNKKPDDTNDVNCMTEDEDWQGWYSVRGFKITGIVQQTSDMCTTRNRMTRTTGRRLARLVFSKRIQTNRHRTTNQRYVHNKKPDDTNDVNCMTEDEDWQGWYSVRGFKITGIVQQTSDMYTTRNRMTRTTGRRLARLIFSKRIQTNRHRTTNQRYVHNKKLDDTNDVNCDDEICLNSLFERRFSRCGSPHPDARHLKMANKETKVSLTIAQDGPDLRLR
ncbi:hypothetical protein J6590_029893 [Homalodisca vitripennis]|nr:hypothetical protein J6590_029893 [Homalodisca vitripennis]